jgi:CRP/FNR family cyclic AMP-dependent transcriptional regulator
MEGYFAGPHLPPISWIANLEQADREAFSSYGEMTLIPSESILIQEGEKQPNFYFVLKGMLSVKQSSEGHESVVGVVGAGESLGEMSMVSGGPASATVTTLEECQLWRISHDNLMRFILDKPVVGNKILLALLCTVSERLHAVDSDLVMILNEKRKGALKNLSIL